jgi:hypothetical protein
MVSGGGATSLSSHMWNALGVYLDVAEAYAIGHPLEGSDFADASARSASAQSHAALLRTLWVGMD